LKNSKSTKAKGVVQVVEHLPGKCKILNSKPIPPKKKKKVKKLSIQMGTHSENTKTILQTSRNERRNSRLSANFGDWC
jgi:hypothetical protein